MILRILLAALLFLAFAGTAHARDEGICTPSSSGIAFGSFTGSDVEVTGSLVLVCAGNGRLNYTVTLSKGAGTYDARLMKQGGNTLFYNLYSDTLHRTVWGDGTGGSRDVRGSVGLRGQALQTEIVTIYALLPAADLPSAGPYSDTIVATVTTDDGVKTSSFPVTAQAAPNCTISATNLAFRDYAGSQVDGQSEISLRCNPRLAWNVGLSPGNFPGATVSSRRMRGPSPASLGYALYRDAARTQNWGNIVGTDTLVGTGSGSPQIVNVFGRIPASQSAASGGYVDTIVATVTF
ncbi:MAG TPA: spore coat U domain-containing protein [Allosphingosinicella sp.]|nr:spore coat U domain-containing protein [Allosphingosinicella sp.]